MNGNGIPDIFEDLNGDGLPDGPTPVYMGPCSENDADCDGIPNDQDSDYFDPNDVDGDGIPNDQDPDYCDSDVDSDGDGVPDCQDTVDNCDPDGDGVQDDTDGDGVPDCRDTVDDCDPDGDGVPNDEDGNGKPDCEDKDTCAYDGSKSGWIDGFVSFLPSSPESIRIPVIIMQVAGEGSLAGNLLLVMWEGVYQLLLIIALIKFYKLLPFV